MSSVLKIIDKVRRFDSLIANSGGSSGGSSLGMLDKFHVMEAGINGQADTPPKTSMPAAGKTYADGLAEGREQAISELETQQANISQAAQNLSRAVQKISAQIEASHGRVATQILQAVLPTLAHDHQMNEIKEFILQISAPALHGCVTVQTPAHLHKYVEDILQDMAAISAPNRPDFKLETSAQKPNQEGTQIRASWQDGGGTIDIRSAAEQCLALLQNNLDNAIGDENGTI